jgi:hypothetical protein
MSNYDLNADILFIGVGRVGKSTEAIQYTRRIYSAKWNKPLTEVDKELIHNGWIFDKVIYDKTSVLAPLKTSKKEVILIDEAYFLADRRESLNPQQIKFIKWNNAYASNNNIVMSLIQDLTDLDSRIYSKANVINLLYERGSCLNYVRSKNFPIIKQTNEFEKFNKKARLLNDYQSALYQLRKLPSYTFDQTWHELIKINKLDPEKIDYVNPLFEVYLKNKKIHQDELT